MGLAGGGDGKLGYLHGKASTIHVCHCFTHSLCVSVCVSVCLSQLQRSFQPAMNDICGIIIGFSWIEARGFSKKPSVQKLW